MMRVLVIEDDLSVGAAIQTMLAREGFQTIHVSDSDTGMRIFESSRFDLVIVDIFIPGESGLTTIARFCKLYPTVPVVAMSGFSFRDTMNSSLDFLSMAAAAGATFCLRKPFSYRQLLAAVHASFDPGVAASIM
jgi:DNA-binding response OmpR family regulator